MAEYTIYLSEPLRKIGDYVDVVNSDGTVTRRIKKLVLTGEEVDWGEVDTTASTRYFILIIGTLNYAISNAVISTHFSQETINSSTTEVGVNILNSTGQGKCYVAVRPENASTATLSGFKAWLASEYAAGKPVTVWYVLATPTTETVTVPTLTPTKGSNTLSIGTTLQPSSVSITGGIK